MSFAFEDQLVILCSQVKLDPAQVEEAMTLLNRALDWEYILEVSIRHGVSPLFYHGLQQVTTKVALDQLVPASVLCELRQLYEGNQRRNSRLFQVITEIFSAFHAAGIAALGLKDVQLAAEVYPPGLRTMGDIDILIHPEQRPNAAAVLAGLGFLPVPCADVPYTHKYAWGQHFRRAQDEVWIDLQHNVMQLEWDCYGEGSFNFEIERMWHRALTMRIDGCAMAVPNPEDMLFHLCLHLEGHAYAELILFCDIVELLRTVGERFGWIYFLAITQKYKVESTVYYVLLLVQQLFQVQIPANVLATLQPIYFKANLFGALYGNLTPLHLSLDELGRACPISSTLLSYFEEVVRQQAANAMQLFKTLDALATMFAQHGGNCLLWEGAVSERIFPDPMLAAFQEVRCLIFQEDWTKLQMALMQSGFILDGSQPGMLTRHVSFTSQDPVLQGQPQILTLQVKHEANLALLLQAAAAPSSTKRAVALHSLKAKGAHRAAFGQPPVVSIKIVALAPEELFLYLCVQFYRQKDARLFHLVSLLEFIRKAPDALNWEQLTTLAQAHQVSQPLIEGIAAIQQVCGATFMPPLADLPWGTEAHPRVLEWARYGPETLTRYTDLKRSYYYLLGLLSTPGIGAKGRYLLRSLHGEHGQPPILPGLLTELYGNVVTSFRKEARVHTAREFAYWIESGVV